MKNYIIPVNYLKLYYAPKWKFKDVLFIEDEILVANGLIKG